MVVAPAAAPVSDDESQLARALALRPLTVRLLAKRGQGTPEAARRFLAPKLAHLRSPQQAGGVMADLLPAVERLTRAIERREPVGIFGDYDVDGVTACALLTIFLRELGLPTTARVAQREGGYGFALEEAEAFAREGCRLIVVCDCGTSDHASVARAGELGCDVIVLDHHQVSGPPPPALAFVNPHQSACRFPFKGLASVGIAFYLAAALATRLRDIGRQPMDTRLLLDLVAIGTIADLAPLVEENRALVSSGLGQLGRGLRPGLRMLMERAGLNPGRPPTSHDVGFRIAPRLNAPGRLGQARAALDLLLADEAHAVAGAEACEEANRLRQQVQERVLEEAIAQVEMRPDRRVIVVSGDGWHPGVVGIVAAKLVDRYRRPAVVIAFDGDRGRGSARTSVHFHLYRGLERCAATLERFGGHAAAAGLTVIRARLADFERAFEQAAEELCAAGPPASEAWEVDAEVSLADIDEGLVEEIALFAPFGVGNPEPVLGVRGLTLEEARVVGEKHLQVKLGDGKRTLDGIGFNLAKERGRLGRKVDAAFAAEMDSWRGQRRLRLRVHRLVSAAAPQAATP